MRLTVENHVDKNLLIVDLKMTLDIDYKLCFESKVEKSEIAIFQSEIQHYVSVYSDDKVEWSE